MRRLAAALAWDLRLQVRHGLFAAGLFAAAIWIGAAASLAPATRRWLAAPFALVDLCVTGYYFVAGLILLEKGEGTLAGLRVTPLRPGEYLAAKVLSLAGLAALEALLVLAVMVGPARLPALVPGVVALAALYALFGVVTIVRYRSLNEFLVPSFLWATLLQLAVLPYAGVAPGPWWYLQPLYGAFVLTLAALRPMPAGELALAAAATAVWLTLAGLWARRAYLRFVHGGAP